jgi:hypothetical protein
MQRIAIVTAVWLLSVTLNGQWLNFRTPGIPRTIDGKPNLTAPAPRTPDGKPDLSGLWRPEFNPYNLDVIQNVKDERVSDRRRKPSSSNTSQSSMKATPSRAASPAVLWRF